MAFGLTESLQSLSLACNGFDEHAGRAVVKVIEQCLRLRHLDLSRNCIGDSVCEQLCYSLDHHCPELEGLGLSGCKLGASPGSGAALGHVLIQHYKLKSLDVSWNCLHGTGA